MSDYADFSIPQFARTVPLFHTVEDMYNITHGTFNEFKLEGYNPPTTAIPLSAEHKIPTDKNRDIFADITKKAKEPDPTTYAAEDEKVYKRCWEKATGKFKKCRRRTFTEETMLIGKKLPGPGDYMPTPKGQPVKATARLGKFSKSEVESFLCNTVALAEEVPAADAYFQKPGDRDKAFAKKERKSPSFVYYPDKPRKEERSSVGPGYLKDLESSFNKSALRKKTPEPSFSKAKTESVFYQKAKSSRYIPGVGTYKEKERAYTSNVVGKRGRVPYISKYKFTRFTEAVSKEKQWVPGPGSYEVVPYAKKPKA